MHGLHTKIFLMYSDFTLYQPEVASFSGPPTIQFLIAHNMQKWKGKAWYIFILCHMNDINVYLGRQREEGSEQD